MHYSGFINLDLGHSKLSLHYSDQLRVTDNQWVEWGDVNCTCAITTI